MQEGERLRLTGRMACSRALQGRRKGRRRKGDSSRLLDAGGEEEGGDVERCAVVADGLLPRATKGEAKQKSAALRALPNQNKNRHFMHSLDTLSALNSPPDCEPHRR